METNNQRLQNLISESLELLRKIEDAEKDLRQILGPDLSDDFEKKEKVKKNQNKHPHPGGRR